MSKKLLKKFYNGHCLYRVIPDPRYLTLLTNGYGTLLADALSGYSGSVVHLTATPDAGYAFTNYECTGATIVGNDLTFGGEDCTAKAIFNEVPRYTLTLQTDGHGTLTANKLTGYAGDTVTLTPTYNTYYRFNNYTNTGGSISNNTFTFGNSNATAKANFKTNDFTAKGNWLLPNDDPDYHTSNGYETVFFAFANVTATNNNSIFVKDKSYILWSRNAATRIQYIDASALKIPQNYSAIKFQTQPGVMIVSGIGGGGQLDVNFMNSGSESKSIQRYAYASVSNAGQSAKINLTATTSNYWGYYTLDGYGSSWRVGIVNPNATWSASGYAP